MEVGSREYKHAKWEELRSVDLTQYHLDAIDERLMRYVSGVQSDEDGHNLYEILGVMKFLRLMRTEIFLERKVKNFVTLYESLKFSGLDGRRSYKLTPIQYYQFANILGFYRWEYTGDATGYKDTQQKAEEGDELRPGEGKRWKIECGKRYELRRLVRRAILFVPRKFSKTTSSASLAINEILFGDANAQAYTAANTYKQAQVAFKEISSIARQLDPKKRYFKALREKLTWLPNKYGKESYVECLSGGGETKDGLNASLVIFDEFAAARYVKGHSAGAELLMVLESSMGARREPLVIIITTASRVPDGPFALELDNAKKVLEGEWDDDHLFASLFMPDGFDEDIGTPQVWRKCNPHIGITVQESYYAKMWEEAQHDQEKMMEFRTKLVNQFVNGSVKTWISRQMAASLQTDFNISACLGRPECMVGVDLSVSDDFSIVVYNIRDKRSKMYYLWLDCYIPEAALETHANKLLYRTWVDAGWMQTCRGEVIDYGQIVEDILSRNKTVKILQIGYDPARAKQFVNSMSAAVQAMGGDPTSVVVPITQSYISFTPAVETIEFAAKSRPAKMALSMSPIWPYAFGNAYLDETKHGLKKPIKEKENLKIDPVIGAIETFWLYGNFTRQVTTQ